MHIKAFFHHCSRKIDQCSNFFFKIACWLVIALVLLTTEQVVARYFFDASSVALQELEWHLFGFIILLSMAHTLQRNEHVRVDILYGRLSERARTTIDVCGYLFFLVPFCLVLIIYGYAYTIAAFDYSNPYPPDHWSAAWFEAESFLYKISARVEDLLRATLLRGEISPDAGGLEARWIIKAVVPFSFMLLLLQTISEVIKKLMPAHGGKKI